MATATGASKLARQVGAAVKQAASKGIGWYGPHMAAASRAISERIPMVDLLLEVRDARVFYLLFDELPQPSLLILHTD